MRILFEPVSYPQKKPSSALPVARASLKPATHTPCDDSQVACDSETFVPANQSSILFRATPLRQQRLNDSERKEKRSGCAFPCAFSRECGMQLSCDVRFRVLAESRESRCNRNLVRHLAPPSARTQVGSPVSVVSFSVSVSVGLCLCLALSLSLSLSSLSLSLSVGLGGAYIEQNEAIWCASSP